LNNDLYGSNARYHDQKKMPLKLPKGFINTLKNIEEGKEFDVSEPMYVDLSKKKGQEGY